MSDLWDESDREMCDRFEKENIEQADHIRELGDLMSWVVYRLQPQHLWECPICGATDDCQKWCRWGEFVQATAALKEGEDENII